MSSGKQASAHFPPPHKHTTPTSTKTGIRLAGATSDVHILDVRSGRWQKATPLGEHPSPRAAHAAAAVGSMVVVQGGIGPAGLASEDLHVLDFTEPDRPRWHRVMVSGPGPSARYAHTLYQWRRIDGTPSAAAAAAAVKTEEEKSQGGGAASSSSAAATTATPDYPAPRMYASAAARSDGLLLLCGGRGADGAPLDDAFGLARHRDGRWEWAAAPGTMPGARYQHGAVFVGARLHVSGGAVGGGKLVDDGTAVAVLDTAAGVWCVPEEEERGEGGDAAAASDENGKDASTAGGARRGRQALQARRRVCGALCLHLRRPPRLDAPGRLFALRRLYGRGAVYLRPSVSCLVSFVFLFSRATE